MALSVSILVFPIPCKHNHVTWGAVAGTRRMCNRRSRLDYLSKPRPGSKYCMLSSQLAIFVTYVGAIITKIDMQEDI